MAAIQQLEGLKEVLANLRLKQDLLALGVERGLKKAGLLLQRESQKMVPVDLGNLKASAFTRSSGKGLKTEVIVGYTAFYAVYVHEAVAMKLKGLPRSSGRGKYWDPQGRAQAKFLEEPFNRLRPEMLKLIRGEARMS